MAIPCSSDFLASLLLDPNPTDLTSQQFRQKERTTPVHSSSVCGVRLAERKTSRQTSALAVGSGDRAQSLATADLSTLLDVLIWRQFADCRAAEHHVGTPLVWALMMVLSRLASRERGSLRLHKICVAFFHAKLEQRVVGPALEGAWAT